MKTSINTMILFLLLNGFYAKSQGPASKPILTVLSIDSRGVNTDPLTMGSMVRTELEKLPEYNVTDKYDVIQFMEANKVSLNNCFGKSCLTEVGLMMKSDKMFSGSIEHFGKILVFTYRLIDVKNSEVEKTYVHEFLYLPEEILNMVKLSVADMFAKPYDVNLMNKLSKPFELDNSNNNPKVERLALDGPREYSVLDTDGNAVAATLSINLPFGAAFTVPGTGILLNDEMDDFAVAVSGSNSYGLEGSAANRLEPGKRPLSSMSPTFLESEREFASFGTPGGSRIPSMTLLAIITTTRLVLSPGDQRGTIPYVG